MRLPISSLLARIRQPIFALVLCLAIPGAAHAQDETPEALFRRGTVMFRQDRLIPARLDFNQVLSRHPDSEWAPAAAMMLAKTFYALGEYSEARATAQILARNYARSPYAEWTPYLEAACDFREGQTDGAIRALAELAAREDDSPLGQHARAALKYTLIPTAGAEPVYSALETAGLPRTALDEVVPVPVSSPSADTGFPVPERAQVSTGGELRIGLLAPLTGYNADLGEYLKRGVEAVLDGRLTVQGRPLRLLIRDTKSDPVTAILATNELIEQGVTAIIGPVLSESNFGPAALADEYGIPFLAPTTTNPNFTDLGSHVFQLNQNPEVQAAALAEFVADIAQFENFAVIASNDPWGEAAAETFALHLTDAGLTEIATGYFTPDMDNHDILMSIRDSAPESAALIDSVVVLNPGSQFPDTLFVRQDQTPRGEQMLLPVNSIDCILISATSEEAVQIASQIMQYNITTVLLGDSGWWSNESYFAEGGIKYIDGAIVVAPTGERSGGRGAAILGGAPSSDPIAMIPFLRGADAAAVLLHCFESGALDPVSLTDMLGTIDQFPGYASHISIDPHRRVNRAVEFVRLTTNGSEPVDRSRPELLRMQLRQMFIDEAPLLPDTATEP